MVYPVLRRLRMHDAKATVNDVAINIGNTKVATDGHKKGRTDSKT